MFLAAAALLGCGPDPEALRAQAATGDLSVLEALAGLPLTGDQSGMVERAQQLRRVLPELDALTQAEGPMLSRAVDEALAAGDLVGAASRLSIAVEAGRTDIAPVAAAIESAARQADASVEHQVLAALADVWSERSAAQHHRLENDAIQAAVTARYSDGYRSGVRAGQVGITRAAAESLLRLLDREYVVEVDWTTATQQAASRLGALGRSASARTTWPGLADAVFTGGPSQSVDEALARLDMALRVGKEAGVPDEVVLDEWVTGALASLDPWTQAVWPAEIAAWSAGHEGVRLGVGLVLEEGPEGTVVIDHPIPDTPAWASGVHQGDRVVSMTDATGSAQIADWPAGERLGLATAALQGPADTAIRLEIQPPDATETRSVHLIRGPVVQETVEGWSRSADDNRWVSLRSHGVAYVRIPRFKPTTEAAFDTLMEPILDQVRGVVIDLRGNPGGDVNSAVQIADRFVADGWLADLSGRVLPETGPDHDPVTGAALAEWNQAIPGHALEGVPVAILVDDQTASAAEVLAGSLAERADAVVVGQPTWGKGLAQALRVDEKGDYAVQFTNVVWTLPSGRRLSHRMSGGGIEPDVVLPLGPASRFQLQRDRTVRGALRVHADGTPMRARQPGARSDLPPLSDDPAVLAAELVLLARMLAESDEY